MIGGELAEEWQGTGYVSGIEPMLLGSCKARSEGKLICAEVTFSFLIIVSGTVFTLGAMEDLVLFDSVFRNSVLPSVLLSRLNFLPYLFPLL